MTDDLVKRLRVIAGGKYGSTANLRDSVAEAADRIEALEEALQSLLDVQNGPPLLKYEDDWQSAMDAARAALAGEKKYNMYEEEESGGTFFGKKKYD